MAVDEFLTTDSAISPLIFIRSPPAHSAQPTIKRKQTIANDFDNCLSLFSAPFLSFLYYFFFFLSTFHYSQNFTFTPSRHRMLEKLVVDSQNFPLKSNASREIGFEKNSQSHQMRKTDYGISSWLNNIIAQKIEFKIIENKRRRKKL